MAEKASRETKTEAEMADDATLAAPTVIEAEAAIHDGSPMQAWLARALEEASGKGGAETKSAPTLDAVTPDGAVPRSARTPDDPPQIDAASSQDLPMVVSRDAATGRVASSPSADVRAARPDAASAPMADAAAVGRAALVPPGPPADGRIRGAALPSADVEPDEPGEPGRTLERAPGSGPAATAVLRSALETMPAGTDVAGWRGEAAIGDGRGQGQANVGLEAGLMPSPAMPEGPRAAASALLPLALPQLREGLSEQVRALAARAGTDISTRRVPDGGLTTEMELAPAELGRLRLVLQTGERGLHLSVVVDRPESLEIVRRHLDGFHRGLLNEGVRLDGVDIGTGDRDQPLARHPARDPGREGGADPADDRTAEGPPPDLPVPVRNLATGRLDIRL